MQWSHHHYKDSPEIDRIGSSPPPWNMHSNKTSLTQYIALVSAYATTEQHHQSPWCRCSDVARLLFCRWQLCVENRHPMEVHQLLFLTWNICQRVLRFTYYTMFMLPASLMTRWEFAIFAYVDTWAGLGGWGGDDDVSITCTHVTCYALDVSCTCTHVTCYVLDVSCTCTHGTCYASDGQGWVGGVGGAVYKVAL